MAIISLKELTLRYSPKDDTLDQLIRDYYAIYPLWKEEGSGAMKFGGAPAPEKRTEVIDQVFEQVATKLAKRLFLAAKNVESYRKIAVNIQHHLKMEDWIELHAEMEKIIKSYLGNSTFYAAKNKVERDPIGAARKYGVVISPLIKQLVSTSKIAPKPPTEVPATPAPEIPAPIIAPSPAPEVPTSVPEKPVYSIAPELPPGVPPLGTPMAGKTPKRLVALEKELERMGYKWSEEEQMYKNTERGSSITIFPDNSSLAKNNTGKEYNFSNLGELLKKLYANRAQPAAQTEPSTVPPAPSTPLTEAHYKTLFNFLYN